MPAHALTHVGNMGELCELKRQNTSYAVPVFAVEQSDHKYMQGPRLTPNVFLLLFASIQKGSAYADPKISARSLA